MKLVVVESPKKGRNIQTMIGGDYRVIASQGHIREIPPDAMNVNISGGFTPIFQVSPDKHGFVSELRREANQADEIYLATDADREGESISWHIWELLDKDCRKKCKRIVFHEVTKKGLTESLKHPGKIDDNMVKAQLARQVLDRLIGYSASPLLWNAVAPRTSAGRVQSVALRLICDRQAEIDAFKPSDFWTIEAELENKAGAFLAIMETEDDNNRLFDEKTAQNAFQTLKTARYKVGKVRRKERQEKAPAPFDTNSLQTAAAAILDWAGTKTMKVAQSLYENGQITYPRTDSFNIADEAVDSVRNLISTNLDKTYLPATVNKYSKKSSVAAQEAHECIRPTDIARRPESLSGDDKALYQLVRERFVACQMSPMILDTVVYTIKTNSPHNLVAKGQTIRFDGWSKIWHYKKTDEETLPNADEGEALQLQDLQCPKHSTKPPDRYSEVSLPKKMETEGVGRPATRAPIIQSIQDKGYVAKDKKAFVPTDLGRQICNYLTPKFNDFFMDVKFTARLEEDLDLITKGKKDYLGVVAPVYEIIKQKIGPVPDPPKPTGEKCSVCKTGEIMEKTGKHGIFYSCGRYPDCKTIFIKDGHKFSVKDISIKPTGVSCSVCETGQVVEKQGAYGAFFCCNRYPECKTVYITDGKGNYAVK